MTTSSYVQMAAEDIVWRAAHIHVTKNITAFENQRQFSCTWLQKVCYPGLVYHERRGLHEGFCNVRTLEIIRQA